MSFNKEEFLENYKDIIGSLGEGYLDNLFRVLDDSVMTEDLIKFLEFISLCNECFGDCNITYFDFHLVTGDPVIWLKCGLSIYLALSTNDLLNYSTRGIQAFSVGRNPGTKSEREFTMPLMKYMMLNSPFKGRNHGVL